MKKPILIAGLFRIAVALVLAAPAVAQHTYTFHVPFRFNVNAQVLPAGEYLVGVASAGTLQIRSVDHNANATLGAHRLNPSSHEPQNAALVFHRYGQKYFLSQAWFAPGDQGYELTVSTTEREFAKQIPHVNAVISAAKSIARRASPSDRLEGSL